MSFEFSQVIAQLVEPVFGFGDAEGGEDGLVERCGAPATDLGARCGGRRGVAVMGSRRVR